MSAVNGIGGSDAAERVNTQVDTNHALRLIQREVQVTRAKEGPLGETQTIQAVSDAVDIENDCKTALRRSADSFQPPIEGILKRDPQAQDHQYQNGSSPNCGRDLL